MQYDRSRCRQEILCSCVCKEQQGYRLWQPSYIHHDCLRIANGNNIGRNEHNSTTATCCGNVTADGGTSVTERGICYSTSQNPTTSNTKITKGSGTGSFTCNMTGLTVGTTYYVRAYAKNGKGTAYGDEVSFNTPHPEGAIGGLCSVSATKQVFGLQRSNMI